MTEINLNSDVSSCFLLNNNYRAKLDHELAITKNTNEHFDLTMRQSVPKDTPIIVNLPHLVMQAISKTATNDK